MKQRYSYYPRENGVFYSLDNLTKKRQSLDTSDREEAQRLVNALNEACKQPAINLQIAQVYYHGPGQTLHSCTETRPHTPYRKGVTN